MKTSIYGCQWTSIFSFNRLNLFISALKINMTNKQKKNGVERPHFGIWRTTFREVRAEGQACEELPCGAGALQSAQAVLRPRALARSQPPPPARDVLLCTSTLRPRAASLLAPLTLFWSISLQCCHRSYIIRYFIYMDKWGNYPYLYITIQSIHFNWIM